MTTTMAMVHLAIRSVSHGSRIKELVTVEAGEASSVVDMFPTCCLEVIIVMLLFIIILSAKMLMAMTQRVERKVKPKKVTHKRRVED